MQFGLFTGVQNIQMTLVLHLLAGLPELFAVTEYPVSLSTYCTDHLAFVKVSFFQSVMHITKIITLIKNSFKYNIHSYVFTGVKSPENMNGCVVVTFE